MIRGLTSPNSLGHPCAGSSSRGWHIHKGGWASAELGLKHTPPKQRDTPLIVLHPYHEGGCFTWVGACPWAHTYTV